MGVVPLIKKLHLIPFLSILSLMFYMLPALRTEFLQFLGYSLIFTPIVVSNVVCTITLPTKPCTVLTFSFCHLNKD